MDDKQINYLVEQIKSRINGLGSEYFQHSMQIQYAEDDYNPQDRSEKEEWIFETLGRIYILMVAYFDMKKLSGFRDLFIQKYSDKIENRSFMLESSGVPYGDTYDILLRLREFGDFLLPFKEFDIFREEKRMSTNILESVLKNTHLIISRTNTSITNETSVYNQVKWFLELLWPKTGLGKLPEFQGEFKYYTPDLHIPDIEVAIEYKLIREKDHPENHIDAVKLDSVNYKGNGNYKIFYAVLYFLNNKNHKEENIQQCWNNKEFPENWRPIFVFGSE